MIRFHLTIPSTNDSPNLIPVLMLFLSDSESKFTSVIPMYSTTLTTQRFASYDSDVLNDSLSLRHFASDSDVLKTLTYQRFSNVRTRHLGSLCHKSLGSMYFSVLDSCTQRLTSDSVSHFHDSLCLCVQPHF